VICFLLDNTACFKVRKLGIGGMVVQTNTGLNGVIADFLPDPLVVVREGRCLAANAAFAEKLGYDSRDVDGGLDVKDFIRTGEDQSIKELLEERWAADNRPNAYRAECVSKSGNVIQCDLSSREIEYQDEPAYVLLIHDISEQVRVDREKRAVEEKYRLLIDSSHLSITFWDENGHLLLMNKTGVDDYEGNLDNLLGKHITEIFPSRGIAFLERNKIVAESREKMVVEDYVSFPSGDKWFLSTLQPVEDGDGQFIGIQVVSVDVTEKKLAEEKYRHTNEQLQATLNTLPDLMFEVDSNGLIYDFRAPDPEMLYRIPEEFIGRRVTQVLPKSASDIIMKAIEEATIEGESKGTVYSLEVGGLLQWFELSLVRKGELQGTSCRLVALVRDITERKRNEEQLKLLADDLMVERTELTEKNAALKQILEHIESQKMDLRQQIYSDIEQGIQPIVNGLRKRLGPDFSDHIDEFVDGLNAILSTDRDEFRKQYGKLTSRESEVCELVKTGMSSKQIANHLNLSVLTVLKHRENIRRKLEISGKQLSLATYLRSK